MTCNMEFYIIVDIDKGKDEVRVKKLAALPAKSLNVLRIGVMEPGALLNDAYKEYEGDESHKADEFVRFIKDKLSNAVLQCIDAAGEEFVPKVQKSLLKSANFGKGFLGSEIQPELVNAFVETCRELRVLNSVRLNKIGIPITLRQYRRLSSGVFVDRLIYHGLYHLALEICDFLKIPPSEGAVKVLRNWALRKVQDKSMSDADVAQKIKRRLKDANVVVSYGEIARAAMDAKRLTLAADVCGYTPL
eukprot:Em0020g654a